MLPDDSLEQGALGAVATYQELRQAEHNFD